MNYTFVKPILYLIAPDEEFRIIDEPIWEIKPNMYAVSNYGRVMNILSGQQLSLVWNKNTCGYVYVGLQRIDNSRYIVQVHRLVAYMFLRDTYFEGAYVNHKDLCKYNNHISNLEWVTCEENNYHARINNSKAVINENIIPTNWSNGSITAGEKNGMSWLEEEKVHKICQSLVETGGDITSAVLAAGLSLTDNNRHLIAGIAGGRKWKHISCQYQLPPRKKIHYYDQYVIPICELFEQNENYSAIDIINILELNKLPDFDFERFRHLIQAIKRGDRFYEISKNYNFTKTKKIYDIV